MQVVKEAEEVAAFEVRAAFLLEAGADAATGACGEAGSGAFRVIERA
jgi:hypothetical protein